MAGCGKPCCMWCCTPCMGMPGGGMLALYITTGGGVTCGAFIFIIVMGIGIKGGGVIMGGGGVMNVAGC